MRARIVFLGLALVVAGLLNVSGVMAQSGPDTNAAPPIVVTFGIVPQQDAGRLVSNWGPVLRFLEDRTGYRLVFQTAPDIPTFEYRVRRGEYDIAYMNPYHYTVFHEQPGYQAFARARNTDIHGILVVAKQSPITHIEELRGREVAFPAPAAFAASLLTQALLSARYVGVSPRYVGSHDAVYRAVAEGSYVAGCGIMRTFLSAPGDVREKLRVLTRTAGYTPHAVAAHPRVDPQIVANIQAALIEIGQDPRGREMVRGLNVDGFQRASDADWNDVRALGLNTRLGG